MHDANGTPLSLGDIVYLPAVITQLNQGEDYCNVSIQSLYGRRPDGLKETTSAINTGVLVLQEKAKPSLGEPASQNAEAVDTTSQEATAISEGEPSSADADGATAPTEPADFVTADDLPF